MQSNRIYLSLDHMGGQEQQFIKEAFDTNSCNPIRYQGATPVFVKDIPDNVLAYGNPIKIISKLVEM